MRIATLLAFVVASLGVPLDVVSESDEVSEGSSPVEHRAGLAAAPRRVTASGESCRTTRTSVCGFAMQVRRAGRCCCA